MRIQRPKKIEALILLAVLSCAPGGEDEDAQVAEKPRDASELVITGFEVSPVLLGDLPFVAYEHDPIPEADYYEVTLCKADGSGECTVHSDNPLRMHDYSGRVLPEHTGRLSLALRACLSPDRRLRPELACGPWSRKEFVQDRIASARGLALVGNVDLANELLDAELRAARVTLLEMAEVLEEGGSSGLTGSDDQLLRQVLKLVSVMPTELFVTLASSAYFLNEFAQTMARLTAENPDVQADEVGARVLVLAPVRILYAAMENADLGPARSGLPGFGLTQQDKEEQEPIEDRSVARAATAATKEGRKRINLADYFKDRPGDYAKLVKVLEDSGISKAMDNAVIRTLTTEEKDVRDTARELEELRGDVPRAPEGRPPTSPNEDPRPSGRKSSPVAQVEQATMDRGRAQLMARRAALQAELLQVAAELDSPRESDTKLSSLVRKTVSELGERRAVIQERAFGARNLEIETREALARASTSFEVLRISNDADLELLKVTRNASLSDVERTRQTTLIQNARQERLTTVQEGQTDLLAKLEARRQVLRESISQSRPRVNGPTDASGTRVTRQAVTRGAEPAFEPKKKAPRQSFDVPEVPDSTSNKWLKRFSFGRLGLTGGSSNSGPFDALMIELVDRFRAIAAALALEGIYGTFLAEHLISQTEEE